jgi:hypothetical protein
MAKLKNLYESFTLVGNAMISRDAEKFVKTEASGKGGWMKKTINFGVKISDTNKIYVNHEAGYWSDETVEKTKNETGVDAKGKSKKKENWVYNGSMVDEKWVADNIAFADRFKKEFTDKINYQKKIRVALEPEMVGTNDDQGNIATTVKKDDKGNIVYAEKEFIFIGDAIDYIKTHLTHDQRIYIYGQTEINQYVDKENQLRTIFNRRISQIRIAREDEENQAVATSNFYFEKEGFDKSDFKNTKKYSITGYRTFQNDEKKIIPVAINYTLDFSSPNVDWEDEDNKSRVEYLVSVFENVKRDKVYLTQWRTLLFEGSEEVELTEKDLSKDLQKRVKLKFITLEQAIKQMRGNAVGDKIKEIKLVMPLGDEDMTDMTESDGYTLDDLIAPPIENKANKVEEKAKEEKTEKQEEVKNDVTKKFDAMFK